jgi:nitric oxide reductase subunit B
MLFALRALRPGEVWRDGLLRFSFWSLNVGLFAMVVISLLPVGLMQTWAAVEHGYWYARSPEFLQSPVVGTFRWLRVIGDTMFTAGVVALVLFVYGLITGHSTRVAATTPAGTVVRLPVH